MGISDFIIDKPEALRTHHKLTAYSLTFIFWFAIVYLWQPLISLIAWAFGYKIFYEHMIILGGYYGFLELLLFYVITIFILGAIFLLWAKVNQWRFRGKDKRAKSKDVQQSVVAEHYGVSADQHQQWMQQKQITILVTEDFQILPVDK